MSVKTREPTMRPGRMWFRTMIRAMGRSRYPAVILVPALAAVIYFSGAVGMAWWIRPLLIALWVALAAVAISRYARRSSPS